MGIKKHSINKPTVDSTDSDIEDSDIAQTIAFAPAEGGMMMQIGNDVDTAMYVPDESLRDFMIAIIEYFGTENPEEMSEILRKIADSLEELA